VPFVEDLVAAYYCVMDPATPMRVRGMPLLPISCFERERVSWLGFRRYLVLVSPMMQPF
jgi:hypothetical protein